MLVLLYSVCSLKREVFLLQGKISANFTRFLQAESSIVDYFSGKVLPFAQAKQYTKMSAVIRELESTSYAFSNVSSYIPTKINWVNFQQSSIVVSAASILGNTGFSPIDNYYAKCTNLRNSVEISRSYASSEFQGVNVFHIGKGFFDEQQKYIGQLDLVFPTSLLKKIVLDNLSKVVSFALLNDAGEIILSDLNLPSDFFVKDRHNAFSFDKKLVFYTFKNNDVIFCYAATIQDLSCKIILGVNWFNYLTVVLHDLWKLTAVLILIFLILECAIRKHYQTLLSPFYLKFKKLKKANLDLMFKDEISQASSKIISDYSGELSNRLFSKVNEIIQRSNILLKALQQPSDLAITAAKQGFLLASINNAAVEVNNMHVVDGAQQVNVEQILIDIVKISLPQATRKSVVIKLDNRIATLIQVDKISLAQLLVSIMGQIILELPSKSNIALFAYTSSFHNIFYAHFVFKDNGFQFLITKQYRENFFSFKRIGWQVIFKFAEKLNGTIKIKHIPYQGNELVLTISY